MKPTEHKKGYLVYLYGESFWHRTLEGAVARARHARRYCSDAQVIDVATWNLVYGGRC